MLSDQDFRELRLVAEAAYRLERWLNQDCIAWGKKDDGRAYIDRLDPRNDSRQRFGSPNSVITLLWALREVLDDLYTVCGWQAFCEQTGSTALIPDVSSQQPAIPVAIARRLDGLSGELALELDVFHLEPATPNQIPVGEIADCVSLVRRLGKRIFLYRESCQRHSLSESLDEGKVEVDRKTAHSTDFRSVQWFGEVFTFTKNQAPVVGLLYQNWEAGTPDVGDETLLLAVDPEAPPTRLAVLFRNNPAWGTMIMGGKTKGTHRLRPPEKS